MAGEFQVTGRNDAALFTLKVHRGDGMSLLGMNWKNGAPPKDFVGFAIEYKEPNGDRFYALKNRVAFPDANNAVNANKLSTLQSPIQKFRWVHFPRNAELDGEFEYRVKPVFMNEQDELSYGEAQTAAIELRRETYPGQLNVTFTRGFVSSQAFVDRYQSVAPIATLLPAKAKDGLTFKPTHPKAQEALAWMGFEARHAVLETLDQAIADQAQVYVVAYDLSEPDVVARLEKLGNRLQIIIDNSKEHNEDHSGETQAAARLIASAGANNVKRQHMGSLQHNKTIIVDGPTVQKAIGGSTNFSWRGFFVQANSAIVLQGASVVQAFRTAFKAYWASDEVKDFGASAAALWTDLSLAGINAKIAFSPHSKENALLKTIADDIADKTQSSLFFSLAFLYQTPGPILEAIEKITNDESRFVYGISDRKVGGLVLLKPDGNKTPVYPWR